MLTSVGDPAVVSVDALGGRSFTGTWPGSPGPRPQRMMRVEMTSPTRNVLCDGMYGRAVISSGAGRQASRGPGRMLVEQGGRYGGVVYVVRDGIARRTEVKLGGDNGTRPRSLRDQTGRLVVLPSGTPLEDGMSVTTS